MNALSVFLLLLFSSFVSSQQSHQASSNSVTVFTSLVLVTGFGAGRTPTVGTSTVVITSTLPPPSATSSSSVNSTASGNGTISATASGNATSSSTSNLPTAPTTVVGGGISGVAPVPGQTGGPYGPPDGYVAGAAALKRNTFLVGLGGCIIGGVLVIL